MLVAPEQVVDVTRAVLDLFRARGAREKRNAARLRYLVEEIGIDRVLELLKAQLPFELEGLAIEPEPASTQDELIGCFRQRDASLWTMGLSVPLGRMTWRQLEGLAVLSNRWSDGQLRTTHEQGIAVINIPQHFKDAAATDAAALGLSVHADPLEMNTVACTGSQFCNIAVTETKGHMFLLMEKLRKKTLKLHGIRIHMSGCPSSCAQHFTADIGLKGVRVRRLMGTREGFDVYLGGGIAGRVHMGLPYKLGVDVDQLPTLIEEVTREYYEKHTSGQTFSAYWREKIQAQEAAKTDEAEYQTPVWICEGCQYAHRAEDPPIFCPSCAGLRRRFARIDDLSDGGEIANDAAEPTRSDGFAFAALDSALSDNEGLGVEVAGHELALFRVDGKVRAIDSACPHEGAPLALGELKDGKVTCPWHGWTFNACTGCSLDPPNNDVRAYETLVEQGRIYVRLPQTVVAGATVPAFADPSPNGSTAPARPVEAKLLLTEVISEGPGVRTIRFDNRQGQIPHDFPGRFVKLCVPHEDGDVWRSFTISSSPTERRWLDLTIKLNSAGTVTPYLYERVAPGAMLKLKGPQGGFYFDPRKHTESLALISAGSGITPMLSIARYLKETSTPSPCTFLYGARTPADILFRDECQRFAADLPSFHYAVTLSRPDKAWPHACGRLDATFVLAEIPDAVERRWFLCGPNEFMESLRAGLIDAGVDPAKIHTEQFHAVPAVQAVVS